MRERPIALTLRSGYPGVPSASGAARTGSSAAVALLSFVSRM